MSEAGIAEGDYSAERTKIETKLVQLIDCQNCKELLPRHRRALQDRGSTNATNLDRELSQMDSPKHMRNGGFLHRRSGPINRDGNQNTKLVSTPQPTPTDFSQACATIKSKEGHQTSQMLSPDRQHKVHLRPLQQGKRRLKASWTLSFRSRTTTGSRQEVPLLNHAPTRDNDGSHRRHGRLWFNQSTDFSGIRTSSCNPPVECQERTANSTT